ncbi:MAG: DUF6029 family protein [Muribaculaceae bacterium]|nr:DUF6029 family protein [Muribaculaceae bacterium]
MKPSLTLAGLLVAALAAAPDADAFTVGGDDGVAFHGSVQFDGLFPEKDGAIMSADEMNSPEYDRTILFNSYADLNMISRYVDAGVRLEFMKWPLPGYEPDFKGWGVPNIYVKGRYKRFELTAGDFYEQFGNGFILRTYQERSLGIDNSIRGGRMKYTPVDGVRLTVLGGVQRRYWDWKKQSRVYGADAEININELSSALRSRGIGWMVGASYVLKHEDNQTIMVPGTDYRLNVPRSVSAWDLRTQVSKGDFTVLGEFAWKGQDPSFDNDYTYGKGTAAMLSATFSRKGLSVLLQAKRSENMAFRSQRMMSGSSAFLNNMPAFSYQHTYALPALYPYATQAAPGEWAFQGSVAYNFKRKTALGGKYGTKIKLNGSYIRGLDHTGSYTGSINSISGTDGFHPSVFGMGEHFYHDFNVTIEKKLTRPLSMTFLYMNQMSNRTVIEGKGGKVRSNIFVLDTKWKIDQRFTLRNELQYLHTHQDKKDWAYGLLELSIAPYLMVSVSDTWNCGQTGTHYYMAGLAGNYRSNRLQLSYGRTRAGFDCSGGVCRYVQATRGFRVAYSYNF